MLGFLTGAAVYGLTYPQVFPQISKLADYGNTTFAAVWNLNVWLVITVFVLMSLLLFYLIDRAGLHRKDSLQDAE